MQAGNANIKRKAIIAATSVWDKVLFPDLVVKNFRKRDSVAIYPNISIIYNRVKKSGNTSITSFLAEKEGFCGNSAREVKAKFQRPDFFSISDARRLSEYHLITCVRCPYTRLLSAFRDKVAPGTDSRYAKVPGFGMDTAKGFAYFVSFLEAGGINLDRHWLPQSSSLISQLDRYEKIFHLERIEIEMEEFLTKVGLPADGVGALATPHKHSIHTTYSAGALTAFYDDRVAKRVFDLYRSDFFVFGYDGSLQ